MLEKDVERRLREQIKRTCPRAYCLKFVSPGFSGVPDRIILLPGGKVVFVELKKPGKTERQRQLFVQAQLRKIGFTVFSGVDSYSAVDEIVHWCQQVYQSQWWLNIPVRTNETIGGHKDVWDL